MASHPPGRGGQRGLERTERGLPSVVLPFTQVPARDKTSPGWAVSVSRILPPARFAPWLITVCGESTLPPSNAACWERGARLEEDRRARLGLGLRPQGHGAGR